MALKMSVCKKCYSKEYPDKEDLWHDIFTHWFQCSRCFLMKLDGKSGGLAEDCKYGPGKREADGSVICPGTISDRHAECIENKLSKAMGSVLTELEEYMIDKGHILVKVKPTTVMPWPVNEGPPPWCPYKEEHK